MLKNSIEYIKSKTNTIPELAIILGSGLGSMADQIEDKIDIPYENIPDFPRVSVEGHSGKLVFGKLKGVPIVAMKGRIHYYEGQGIDKVVYPIKVLAGLGVKKLIVTNAAGGVNEGFSPGDLMLISDHINFTGVNPLVGLNDERRGPGFLDMTYTYSKDMRNIAKVCAGNLGLDLQEGVYMWFTGPTYETPAEVRLARTLGADAVGMSTVPEVIVARHRGLEVLGISCITNSAAGILDKPLDHNEVIEVSNKVQASFQNLVTNLVKELVI